MKGEMAYGKQAAGLHRLHRQWEKRKPLPSYYDALYDTLTDGKPPLVTEEQTMAQMRILEEAGASLK